MAVQRPNVTDLNGQRVKVSGQQLMVSGQPLMVNGQRLVASGQRQRSAVTVSRSVTSVSTVTGPWSGAERFIPMLRAISVMCHTTDRGDVDGMQTDMDGPESVCRESDVVQSLQHRTGLIGVPDFPCTLMPVAKLSSGQSGVPRKL